MPGGVLVGDILVSGSNAALNLMKGDSGSFGNHTHTQAQCIVAVEAMLENRGTGAIRAPNGDR